MTQSPERGTDRLVGDAARRLLDVLPIAVVIELVTTEVVYFNDAAARLLLWDESMIGRLSMELGIAPTDQATAAAILERVVKGATWTGEFPVRRTDGRTLLAALTALPVVLEGQVRAVAVTVADATDRRLIDETMSLLDSLMTTAPVGLAFYDSEVRFVRVNRTLAEIDGIREADHVGRRVDELLPDVGPQIRDLVLGVIQTNAPALNREVTGRTPARPEPRTWLANYYPIRAGDGTAVGAGGVLVDVTDRKHVDDERDRLLAAERVARSEAETARGRLEILASSSARLAGSLDWGATLANVAGLLVPHLADVCVIDLLEDERLRRAHVSFADPALDRRHAATLRAHAPQLTGRRVHGEVIRTGRTLRIDGITAEQLRAIAVDEAHFEAMAFLEGACALVVPLLARGRVMGVLTLALRAGHGHYSDDDVRLAEELARRGALALDNARVYDVERRLADTLQRSLLPAGPLRAPGGQVAVRYLAAESEAEVGGDFYDVVVVGPDQPWTMAVGDVGGKGARAAAVMGQLRAATRAYALEGHSPAGVVRRLDLLFETLDASDFTTCLVASYDPARRTLRWANAGHLPPLLRRADGSTTWLHSATTLPLGLAGAQAPEETWAALAPGELLVLYTDGLVERRDADIDEGLGRLAQAVAAVDGTVEEIATMMLERLLRDVARDDIALLVFRAD